MSSSNIEPFPVRSRTVSEYQALVSAPSSVLDAMPGGVYLCDHQGWVVRHNRHAVALWGQSPATDGKARFCGAHMLFRTDGTYLAHADCPMATAVQNGEETRNAEVVIERPDGSRITALVNIRPLRDEAGAIEGAINCFRDITAVKALEEEHRRSSRDLEDFFENCAVGLHIVASDGTILRANKAELALLGYPAEDYVGRHIAEFHADAPVIGDILHRLSGGEVLDRYPARLRARDGSIRHVLITSNARMENGKLANTRCFTLDVTAQHEAEAARRESDERLAATYQAAPLGIAEVDAAGRFVRVNDALCRILGRSREEMLATSFLDNIPPDDRDKDAALYARQVSGELATYAIAKCCYRPDGSKIRVEVASSAVRDPDGRFRYGVRIVQDVTERKRMQDRLEDSERHLRELLEALPAAIYTTDAEGRITFFNQAAVDLSGRTPELGSDSWCVTWRLFQTDGTPLPHDQCPMALALKEGRPIRGAEAMAERPDGTRIPFEPYPTPLRDGEGNVVGGVNMLIDISERKRAEQRQKVLIDELNHRVKNTLATVQSLARQTARHTGSQRQFIETFEARLMGLARVHELLARSHWEGAALQTLIRDIVGPYVEAGRIRIDGPPVDLEPRSALAAALALNELVTNACKYGALSRPAGTLSIAWTVRLEPAGQVIDLDWQERGGPTVSPPSRRGFGTRLVERSIEADLSGHVDLRFEPDGLVCRMSIPLSANAPSAFAGHA